MLVIASHQQQSRTSASRSILVEKERYRPDTFLSVFALVHADRSFAFVRDPHIWNCRSYIGIDLLDSVAARILTEATTGVVN